jgi:hypothetical protein
MEDMPMRVRIDGEEWNPETGLPESREGLLGQVRVRTVQRGRIIKSIRVDGVEIDAANFGELSGGQDFAFETQSVRELLRESLRQVGHYAPALTGGLAQVADLLEAEKPQEAMSLFQQTIDGIGWILQVIDRAREILGLKEGELHSGDFAANRETLQGHLHEVEAALSGGRYFELSFRIREDLIPSVRTASAFAEELRDRAEERIQ